MNISKITNYNNSKNKISFKKGLTSYEINRVRNMTTSDREAIVNRLRREFNMNANVGNSNCVAFCLEKTVEIMSRAGFKLPKKFEFAPEEEGALGAYYPYQDKVVINSGYSSFFNDLTSQNILEESQKDFHPDTRHFLHSYLHEFSHAAHFANIREKNPYNTSDVISFLNKYSPADIMVNPIKLLLQLSFPQFLNELMADLFPSEKGEYSKSDLMEYMAEHNARNLALQLGDDFYISNVKYNFASDYEVHPDDWDKETLRDNINELKNWNKAGRFLKFLPGGQIFGNVLSYGPIMAINNLLSKDIEYTSGDIWNGDTNKIVQKSLTYNLKDVY